MLKRILTIEYNRLSTTAHCSKSSGKLVSIVYEMNLRKRTENLDKMLPRMDIAAIYDKEVKLCI